METEEKKLNKKFLSIWTIIYLIIGYNLANFTDLSNFWLSFFSLGTYILLPLGVGETIISLIDIDTNRFGTISEYFILWSVGTYFLTFLVGFLTLLDINFSDVILVLGIILVVRSITILFSVNIKKSVSFILNIVKSSSNKRTIFILILVNSIVLTALYKNIQTFPCLMTHEFHHIHIPLQLVDGEGFSILGNNYFPTSHILIAVSNYIFGLHPLESLWALPFLFNPLISIITFYISENLFKNKFISLLASLTVVWILVSSPVLNNPQLITSSSYLYIYFAFSLYYLIKNRNQLGNKIDKENITFLFLLFFALFVFFIERVLIQSEDIKVYTTLFLYGLILPVIISSLHQRNAALSLFFFMIILSFMLHPYTSMLSNLILISYFVSNLIKESHLKLITVVMVFCVLIFVFLQKIELIKIQDKFLFSKLIFGSLYEEIRVVMLFEAKYNILIDGITKYGFYFTMFFVPLLYFIKGKKQHLGILLITFLGLFIYFLPESFFIREKHLILLISLVLSGAFYFVSSIIMKSSLSRFLIPLFLIFYFTNFLYLPVIGSLNLYYQENEGYYTIQPFEYIAGVWIRENTPEETLILSDPYTINLIASLANRLTPYEKKWVLIEEYSDKSKEKFIKLREGFNALVNCDESAYEYLKEFILEEKYRGKIVKKNIPKKTMIIFSSRTEKWLEAPQDNTFIKVCRKIKKRIDEETIKNVEKSSFLELIYCEEGKIYIYEVK